MVTPVPRRFSPSKIKQLAVAKSAAARMLHCTQLPQNAKIRTGYGIFFMWQRLLSLLQRHIKLLILR